MLHEIDADKMGRAGPGQPPSVIAIADFRAVVREVVTNLLTGRGHPAVFDDHDVLSDIGVSSVDMVALILALESRLDVDIPRRDMTAVQFRSVSTVTSLMARLAVPHSYDSGG